MTKPGPGSEATAALPSPISSPREGRWGPLGTAVGQGASPPAAHLLCRAPAPGPRGDGGRLRHHFTERHRVYEREAVASMRQEPPLGHAAAAQPPLSGRCWDRGSRQTHLGTGSSPAWPLSSPPSSSELFPASYSET